ncbi:hypothetical protein WA158_003811 [Blastocystis sp. Blastoise]
MEFTDLARRTQIPISTFCGELGKYQMNPYDGSDPDGVISLALAEDCYTYAEFEKRLPKYLSLHPNDLRYGKAPGRPYLRQALAEFLHDNVFKCDVNPDNLIVSCGSATDMDYVASLTCHPGDAILIISPCYNCFEKYLTTRSEAVLYTVDTTFQDYKITEEALSQVYEKAVNEGHQPKLCVFTNPTNPMGTYYTRKEMELLLTFCRSKNMHILSDEVYALCVEPLKEGEEGYISYANIIKDDKKKDDVHVIWALSKDFALSGLRFACLFTQNPVILSSCQYLNICSEMPSICQSICTNLLLDKEYHKVHLPLHQEGIRHGRELIEKFFDSMNIKYTKGNACFFIWTDLSSYLKENTFEGEMELYHYIYEKAKVIICPGQSFKSKVPGWYRITYCANPDEVNALAYDRLRKVLNERKAELNKLAGAQSTVESEKKSAEKVSKKRYHHENKSAKKVKA